MLKPPQSDGSNEYQQYMFWSKNKKKVYPCKPQFYYIKVGCKGVYITRTCYPDVYTVGDGKPTYATCFWIGY